MFMQVLNTLLQADMRIEVIRERYPDHVPCHINFEGATVLKLILPCCTRVCEMHLCVRKRMITKGIQVRAEEALFVFVDGMVPASSSFVSDFDIDKSKPVTFEVQRETTFG